MDPGSAAHRKRAAQHPGHAATLSTTTAELTLPAAPSLNQGSRIQTGRNAVRFPLVLICALTAASFATSARAQISDDVVRIGVLNDQSGLYADLGGPGSVAAARMAVEDAGGTVLGKPVEIVFADHQNKADIGVAVARQWFDTGQGIAPHRGSCHGRNHHNFNEHPRSPKLGREASPRRRVRRIDPLVPNRIVIFEQTHVSDPDLGA